MCALSSVAPLGAQAQLVLTVEQALVLALERNPDLAVIRSQRGIAAAGVVIARTYPFNPIWQSYYLGTDASAVLGSSRFATIHDVRLDIEMRGQGKLRRQAAQAALSRAEWEISVQELLLGTRTIRAFHTLVYRQAKLGLLEEMVALQQQAVERVQRLVQEGLLRPVELQLVQSDLVEARVALGPARAQLVAGWVELRRQLGLSHDDPTLQGCLDDAVPDAAARALEELARAQRPELHVARLLVAEAEERVRLEIANRYGNPSVGPAIRQTEEKVTFTGAWMIYPVPVLNTRRGEILQRQAERDRALAEQRRVEVQVGQELQAAIDRLSVARQWLVPLATETIPTLQRTVDTLDKLFEQGEPGIDVMRPIDARRRLLRARDTYLDALWELAQARTDLAAAVGDMTLALCPPRTTERPTLLPPAAVVGH